MRARRRRQYKSTACELWGWDLSIFNTITTNTIHIRRHTTFFDTAELVSESVDGE